MEPPFVFLDNASSTQVDPEVAAVYARASAEHFANPSSIHKLGIAAEAALRQARATIAETLFASPEEIIFTSGATEANAMALLGVLTDRREQHIVSSKVEHASVAETLARLAGLRTNVAWVAPDRAGTISSEALAQAVREHTSLCTLLWVQNELGSIQPLQELIATIRNRSARCHIHVDAAQAIGKLPISLRSLGCDSLAFSGHKIHAPKGIGALWLRRGKRLQPLYAGGGQERGFRPGTENLPGAIALAHAVVLAERHRPAASQRMLQLRDRLWHGIRDAIPASQRNGVGNGGAPHLLSINFPETPAEPLLHALAAQGVYVSNGSACHARVGQTPTLRAIGVPPNSGTLRFSLSRYSTQEEIERAITAVVRAWREIS